MASTTDIVALGLSGGSLVVACWAGVTAHRARQWQVKRDAERRATRVRLDFIHSTGPEKIGHASWGSGQPAPVPRTVYTLSLSVTNEGEETEYVTAAFLEQTAGDNGLRIYGSEGGIDGDEQHELRPRATQNIPVLLDRESIAFLKDGFVAEVWLGSGERVESDTEELLPELLAGLG